MKPYKIKHFPTSHFKQFFHEPPHGMHCASMINRADIMIRGVFASLLSFDISKNRSQREKEMSYEPVQNYY